MTPRGSTTRTLRSEGGAADDRLRVFVAEGSASDLFWLEMVFKSSRLPYRIDVATDADAARQYLENNANARQMDLIFLDTVEILHHVAVPIDVPAFLLMKVLGEETGARAIEKPFTQQKLLDCLSEAGLDAWASRLAGKSIETATAA